MRGTPDSPPGGGLRGKPTRCRDTRHVRRQASALGSFILYYWLFRTQKNILGLRPRMSLGGGGERAENFNATDQEWGERSRTQINAEKSNVMALHGTTAEKNSRTKPRKTRQGGIIVVVRATPFHILSRFPNRFPLDRHPAGFLSTRLKEVNEFVNLGLRLDSKLSYFIIACLGLRPRS